MTEYFFLKRCSFLTLKHKTGYMSSLGQILQNVLVMAECNRCSIERHSKLGQLWIPCITVISNRFVSTEVYCSYIKKIAGVSKFVIITVRTVQLRIILTYRLRHFMFSQPPGGIFGSHPRKHIV